MLFTEAIIALLLIVFIIAIFLLKYFLNVKIEKLKLDLSIPKAGDRIPFYDQGKVADYRRFIAIVQKVIPVSLMKVLHPYIYLCWKQEKELSDLLYSPKTKCFIECIIPGYDNEKVYFAEDLEGGWYSFSWKRESVKGKLDFEGKKSLAILKTCGYLESELFKKDKEFFIPLNFEMIQMGINGKYRNLISKKEAIKIFINYCRKAYLKEKENKKQS